MVRFSHPINRKNVCIMLLNVSPQRRAEMAAAYEAQQKRIAEDRENYHRWLIQTYGEKEARRLLKEAERKELRSQKFWDTVITILSAIIVIAVWILSLQK